MNSSNESNTQYDVFLSYRRDGGAAEARLIQAKLLQNGMRAFLDVDDLGTGHFDEALLKCISDTPNFIVILSPHCLDYRADEQDWLLQELAQAVRTNRNIIPVRMPGFQFPSEAATADIKDLDKYQSVSYSHEFFDAMISKIIAHMRLGARVKFARASPKSSPKQSVTPSTIDEAQPKVDYYLERQIDRDLQEAVARGASTIVIQAAHWMGKTALLARTFQKARAEGSTAIVTNLQGFDTSSLDSSESFFMRLGDSIADQLDLDVFLSDVWIPVHGSSINFGRYLKRQVLPTIQTRLVWLLDEVDRIFPLTFSNDFFAILRVLHNQRLVEGTVALRKLTVVLAHANEKVLYINDLNQSPFNIGVKLRMAEFTLTEVVELNRRYGSPLKSTAEIERFFRLLGGQPYLTSNGLRKLSDSGMNLGTFESDAIREIGFFGEHSRILLALIEQDSKLCHAVRELLDGKVCPTLESFYRLRAAGLVRGDTLQDAKLSCQLYVEYLKRHLSDKTN